MRAAILLAFVACTPTAAPTGGAPPVPDAAPSAATIASAPEPALPTPNPDGGSPDLIDRLVAGLARNLTWNNGTFAAIDLPADAPVDAIVAKIWEVVGFREGHVSRWKIRKVRRVRVGDAEPPFVAAIVDTNFGRQVVLLRYLDGKPRGWWQRVYAEDEWPLRLPVSDAGFVQ